MKTTQKVCGITQQVSEQGVKAAFQCHLSHMFLQRVLIAHIAPKASNLSLFVRVIYLGICFRLTLCDFHREGVSKYRKENSRMPIVGNMLKSL